MFRFFSAKSFAGSKGNHPDRVADPTFADEFYLGGSLASELSGAMQVSESRARTAPVPNPWENDMGLFSKDIKTMDDLFLHVVQDVYYAEQQILKSLPDMIELATNRDLSAGLRAHKDETEKQIGRLEEVFKALGKEPKGVNCPAIDGILKEAKELTGEVADKQVLDAAIIAAAQAVEHYEITRYGTLIAWANELGRDNVVRLLTTNLNEEKSADKKLTTVAESRGVNRKAAS